MFKNICAILLMVFACTSVMASEENGEGKIDYVNPEYLDVVIDDSVYTFALNMKVYDTKGRTVNRYALKSGAQVKYQFVRGANRQKQLSNVWIVSGTSN